MSAKRKKFSKQFKLDAIQFYENGDKSMTQVERELGITEGALGKWRAELQCAFRVVRANSCDSCSKSFRAVRVLMSFPMRFSHDATHLA